MGLGLIDKGGDEGEGASNDKKGGGDNKGVRRFGVCVGDDDEQVHLSRGEINSSEAERSAVEEVSSEGKGIEENDSLKGEEVEAVIDITDSTEHSISGVTVLEEFIFTHCRKRPQYTQR